MNYAIAMPEGSPWVHEVSKIIAGLGTKGKLRELEAKWWPRKTCKNEQVSVIILLMLVLYDFRKKGTTVVEKTGYWVELPHEFSVAKV